MGETRTVDAYCEVCGEARTHKMSYDDPGSCVCTVCSHVQIMMHPLDP